MVSEPSDDGPRASISEIEALAINFNSNKMCCKLSLIALDLRCNLKWQTYNNKWVQLYLNCGNFRMIVVQPTYDLLFMLILDLAPNFHIQKLDLNKQMCSGWKCGILPWQMVQVLGRLVPNLIFHALMGQSIQGHGFAELNAIIIYMELVKPRRFLLLPFF